MVLIDDVASSGRTLALATQLVLAAGAKSVDVAVTLFSALKKSGVGDVALALRVSPLMTALVLLAGAGLALAVRGRIEGARETGERVSTAWSRLYGAIGEHLATRLGLAHTFIDLPNPA